MSVAALAPSCPMQRSPSNSPSSLQINGEEPWEMHSVGILSHVHAMSYRRRALDPGNYKCQLLIQERVLLNYVQ